MSTTHRSDRTTEQDAFDISRAEGEGFSEPYQKESIYDAQQATERFLKEILKRLRKEGVTDPAVIKTEVGREVKGAHVTSSQLEAFFKKERL